MAAELMAAEPMEAELGLSEYEAKRRRRMEENRKKLLELNIFKIPQRPARSRTRKTVPQEPTRRSTRKRTQRVVRYTDEFTDESEWTSAGRLEEAWNAKKAADRRRSLRPRAREADALWKARARRENDSESEAEDDEEDVWESGEASGSEAGSGGKEEEAWKPSAQQGEVKRARREPRWATKHMRREAPKALHLPTVLPCSPSVSPSAFQGRTQRQSSSLLSLELGTFHWRWLGKQLFPVGKHTVMQGMCPPGYSVRFSNMSGVQPWRNGVALFVNVESDSQYNNVFHEAEFLDGQRAVHFQWFGQSRWQDASPAMVRRLLLTQRGDERLRFDETFYESVEDAGAGAAEPEPLLLFLRQTQGPYVYCGRLGYLGHRTSSQPMEFRWQLLDLPSLDWTNVRCLLDAPSDKVHCVKVG